MSHELATQQQQLQELTANTSVVLEQNISSADKAVEFGNSLLSEIEASGMSEEMDKRCNDYLVKARKTYEAMNARRKPVTQMFDQVKKLFTAEESKIDPKSYVFSTVQAYRNSYAKKLADERQKKEDEARKKLEKDKERTYIIEQYKIQLNTAFYDFLNKVIEDIQKTFNSTTLENYFNQATAIAALSKVYPKNAFESFKPLVRTQHHTIEQLAEIRTEVLSEDAFNKFAVEFAEQVEKSKEEYLEKLPAKKEELEEIAAAEKEDKAKADKLKKEAEAREKKETEDKAAELAEKEKKDNEEAGREKAEADMGSLFNATKEVPAQPAAQTKTTLKINIKHQAAFVQIFQMWFENEGSSLPIDKLEKKTLGMMKRYCENLATKEGTIIESDYVEYVEDIKAIAK